MQKIVPSLWFDKDAEEAMKLYTSVFPNARIASLKRYPEAVPAEFMTGMEGKVLTGIFELAGYRFMALDGGPLFQFNPSISFHVKCGTKDEVDAIWDQLSEEGTVLMELGQYPFSERYGWLADRYGLSWQIIFTDEREIQQRITPVLMFVGEVCGMTEEAIGVYDSVFPNANAQVLARYGHDEEPDKEGTVKYASIELFGQEFGAMDSAHRHDFAFNEAISFYVECEDQEEVNSYWEQLSAVPESEQCGWLKDQFGVSWQIIPKQLGELLSDPDEEKVGRVMDAMLKMKKIGIADLERAAMG